MKYAIISDPHGNLPALEAVLSDARKAGADAFLLLGDYVEDFPYPNQIVEAVRRLKNAHVVRGNKEGYFLRMLSEDQSGWVYDQLAALYWNFRALSPENLSWLTGLPESLSLPQGNGRQVFLCHSSRAFLGVPEKGIMRSRDYGVSLRERPRPRREVLEELGHVIASDPAAMERLEVLPDGAYCFGHTHLQWHARIGGKLLINPGSCGLPLDLTEGAPYTVLDTGPEEWAVTEYRAPYDPERAIADLKASPLCEKARFWSDIIIQELRRSEDLIEDIFLLAKQVSQERGEYGHPFSNEVWRLTGERWREELSRIVYSKATSY